MQGLLWKVQRASRLKVILTLVLTFLSHQPHSSEGAEWEPSACHHRACLGADRSVLTVLTKNCHLPAIPWEWSESRTHGPTQNPRVKSKLRPPMSESRSAKEGERQGIGVTQKGRASEEMGGQG